MSMNILNDISSVYLEQVVVDEALRSREDFKNGKNAVLKSTKKENIREELLLREEQFLIKIQASPEKALKQP
jgi:hypothetical protein